MHPWLVRHLVMPLMLRRTWPGVRREQRAMERRQWAPRARIEAYQLEKLRHLVGLAKAHSPFWREALAGIESSEIRHLADLRRLPILEKTALKAEHERIVREDLPREGLTESATGGTTGEPTRYFWDDRYWMRSSAASYRAYSMAGFQLGERHVMFWGTGFGIDPAAQRAQERHEARQNRLVVPGFELGEESLPGWMQRASAWSPVLVEGYTSLLQLAARWIEREGFEGLRPKAVISSAEKLHDWQRTLFEKAFGAPVFDRYGSREVGCIAAECDRHHGLHISADHLIVEILRGDEPVEPGESGDVVVTSLSNEAFPFLRYRIGDVAALEPKPCPCGRGLPLMKMTEGRTHDLLTTAHGTYLPGEFFPHLFKDYPGVQAFQVHQQKDRSVDVRVVRNERWAPEQEASWRREVATALGEGIAVRYSYVEEIPRTRTGKLRFTISEAPVDLLQGKIAGGEADREESPSDAD